LALGKIAGAVIFGKDFLSKGFLSHGLNGVGREHWEGLGDANRRNTTTLRVHELGHGVDFRRRSKIEMFSWVEFDKLRFSQLLWLRGITLYSCISLIVGVKINR
jgi:hypothetical protein